MAKRNHITGQDDSKPAAFAVDVRKVSFSLGDTLILEDVSFILRSGQILGIAGPEGAGKSTLLHLCLGRMKPTQGSVRILGMTPSQLGPRKREIGYMAQGDFFGYAPEMGVMDVVLDSIMPFELLKRNRSQALEAGSRALELAHAGDLAGRLLRDLAPSQIRSLRLAKAIVNEPRILILDDPASDLSRPELDLYLQTVDQIRSAMKLTVMLLGRRAGVLSSLVDEIVWLNHRIMYCGDPDGLPEDFE